MPREEVKTYANASCEGKVSQARTALANSLQFLSQKGNGPGVEFVIPVKRQPFWVAPF
jgi:hypothetical protein